MLGNTRGHFHHCSRQGREHQSALHDRFTLPERVKTGGTWGRHWLSSVLPFRFFGPLAGAIVDQGNTTREGGAPDGSYVRAHEVDLHEPFTVLKPLGQ